MGVVGFRFPDKRSCLLFRTQDGIFRAIDFHPQEGQNPIIDRAMLLPVLKARLQARGFKWTYSKSLMIDMKTEERKNGGTPGNPKTQDKAL